MSYNSMKVNGVDINTQSMFILRVPPVVKPQRRVRIITIPGRSGNLTEWSGDYESYVKEPELLYTGSSPDTAANFLRAATLVTFGNESTLAYDCRVDESFKTPRGKAGEYIFTVPMIVQPLKRLATEAVSTGSTSYSLTNPGNEIAYPKLVITGAGEKTVTVGSQVLTINFAGGGETITIDALNGYVYDNFGNSVWVKVTGDLPSIPVSASAITVSTTGSSLTVYPNWRFS